MDRGNSLPSILEQKVRGVDCLHHIHCVYASCTVRLQSLQTAVPYYLTTLTLLSANLTLILHMAGHLHSTVLFLCVMLEEQRGDSGNQKGKALIFYHGGKRRLWRLHHPNQATWFLKCAKHAFLLPGLSAI